MSHKYKYSGKALMRDYRELKAKGVHNYALVLTEKYNIPTNVIHSYISRTKLRKKRANQTYRAKLKGPQQVDANINQFYELDKEKVVTKPAPKPNHTWFLKNHVVFAGANFDQKTLTII